GRAGADRRSGGTMVSVGERPVPTADAGPRARVVTDEDARPPRSASRDGRRHLLWLGVVVLIAVVARFWGLLYGLPHSYYPDESSVVGDALKMATTGDLRPNQFLWPTFWIYVVALSMRIGLVASWLPVAGIWPLGTAAL